MNILMEMIKNKGFQELGHIMFGTRNICVVYKKLPYVISFIDFETLPEKNKEIFEDIDCKINNVFDGMGLQKANILKIVLTENLEEAKQCLSGDDSHWYITKEEGKLIVSEGQPDDYLGIRSDIEEYLAAEEIETSDKRSNKFLPENFKIKEAVTITNLLIAANIIVYIITALKGDVLSASYIHECGGLMYADIFENKEWYRLFTCNFLHFGLDHLLSNMLMLFLIGGLVEKTMGKIPYIITYIGAGLFSSVGTIMHYRSEGITNSVSAGASGAVFGITGALLVLLLVNKDKRAKQVLVRFLMFLVIALAGGLFQTQVNGVAHIAGFFGGMIISFALVKKM